MHYTEALTWYRDALRRDPKTPYPKARFAPVAEYREWKEELRAFDAARLELGLVTPAQLQAQNAAMQPIPGRRGRIVKRATDGR